MNKKSTKKSIEIKYIIAVIISLILGGSVVGYGYLNYKYKMEELKSRTEAQETKNTQELIQTKYNKNQLQNCLDNVSERTTKAFNISNEKSGGNLSNEGAMIVLEVIQSQRDECFKKYEN